MDPKPISDVPRASRTTSLRTEQGRYERGAPGITTRNKKLLVDASSTSASLLVAIKIQPALDPKGVQAEQAVSAKVWPLMGHGQAPLLRHYL